MRWREVSEGAIDEWVEKRWDENKREEEGVVGRV